MQTTFRGNLSAANFPLVSDFMGRSVVIPQYDQNFQRRKQFSGDDSDLDIGVPQVYYCHNVMPIGQGFKSIAYRTAVRSAPASNFVGVVLAKDPSENKALLGITATGKVYLYAMAALAWIDISAATGGWTGGEYSYAYANGNTYLCLSKFNVFKVDVVGQTLTPVTFAGLTMSAIKGICSSSNYLLTFDDVTVYWSSAIDPEDFVPSLITGAGSGTPQDINGKVVTVQQLGGGFAVYTATNIILASYSGNLRYPWLFKPAGNSAGIANSAHVAADADQGSSYAWTSAGLLKVTAQGCTPVFPEVTDFLSGRIFEDFDVVTNALQSQYLDAHLQVKLTYASSRYLMISYGVDTLTHALVYDAAMKRWGKLKLDHVACFELATNSDKQLTFTDLGTAVFDDYSALAFDDLTTLTAESAAAKRTIAFLRADGSVKIAVWDYGNFSADAVIVLGKYQLTRSSLSTLHEVQVETIDSANPNFAVVVLSTVDGNTIYSNLNPALSLTGARVKKYNCRVTGANHSIVFKGAFTLVSFLLSLSKHGRR